MDKVEDGRGKSILCKMLYIKQKFDYSYIWGISADALTVYDYGFDQSYYGKGVVMRPWSRITPLSPLHTSPLSSTTSLQSSFGLQSPLVLPTDEVLRMSFLLPSMLQSARPILLVGPRGSGKSTIVSHIVRLLSNKGYLRVNLQYDICLCYFFDSPRYYLFPVHLSHLTSAATMEDILEGMSTLERIH